MIKYITHLFYRYYSTGNTKDYSFFSALTAVLTVMFLTLLLLVTIVSAIFPNVRNFIIENGPGNKASEFVIALVLSSIGYFVLSRLIKEDEIRTFDTQAVTYRFGLPVVVVYVVVCFVIIGAVALKFFKH